MLARPTRETVSTALANAGLHLIITSNGNAALAVLESAIVINLVFANILMLGQINGVELAKIVLIRFSRIRIVVATGCSDIRTDIASVHLLAKPYELVDVIQILTTAAS